VPENFSVLTNSPEIPYSKGFHEFYALTIPKQIAADHSRNIGNFPKCCEFFSFKNWENGVFYEPNKRSLIRLSLRRTLVLPVVTSSIKKLSFA